MPPDACSTMIHSTCADNTQESRRYSTAKYVKQPFQNCNSLRNMGRYLSSTEDRSSSTKYSCDISGISTISCTSLSTVKSDCTESTILYNKHTIDDNVVLIESILPMNQSSVCSQPSVDTMIAFNQGSPIGPSSNWRPLNDSDFSSVSHSNSNFSPLRKNILSSAAKSLPSSPSQRLNSSSSTISTVCSSIGRCDNKSLRRRLLQAGDSPGPITEGTRRIYERRLQKLLKQPDQIMNSSQQDIRGNKTNNFWARLYFL